MTLKERLDLWLHKSECVKVIVFKEIGRVSSYIKRVDTEDFIEMHFGAYKIERSKVFYTNDGIPTLIFYYDNPIAIDPKDSKAQQITAEEVQGIMKNKIVRDIIAGVNSGTDDLKNVVLIVGAVLLVAIGGLGYYLVDKLNTIIEFIDNNKDVIELIKDFLITNGG